MRANSKKPPRGAPPLRIRHAREVDLVALNVLYRELHGDDYDSYAPSLRAFRIAWRGLARNRDHHLLVAERGGVIVGTVHLLLFRHLGHGLKPVAIVENVVVASAMRSQSVGERMMEAAGAIAKAAGCYKLSLTTNVKRPRAHRFYERMGWRRSHFGYTLALE
jgi:GNAT superfamily N-acetyltransferase